jgi:hypothetical protein
MSTPIDLALGVTGVAAALPGLVQVCRETQYFEQSRKYISVAGKCPTNEVKGLISCEMSVGSGGIEVLLRPVFCHHFRTAFIQHESPAQGGL